MSYRLQQKKLQKVLTRLQNRGLEVTITPIVKVEDKPPRHKSPCRMRRDAKRLEQFGPPKGSPHLRHTVIYWQDAEMEVRGFYTLADREKFIKDGGLKSELCILQTFPSEWEAMEYMDNVRQHVAACAED